MKVQVTKEATQAQINKVIKAEASKSQKMKDLFMMGLEIKAIAELMGTRYNFVYNVVSNHVNMNHVEVVQTKKESKKDQIIEMHVAGKTNKEISIDLKTNYNYVFNTIKDYKSKQEASK